MKRLINISLLTLIIFGFQNCEKEPCKVDRTPIIDTTFISIEDRLKIPVTGTDTIIYYSNTGDTAKLYGTYRNTFFESVNSLTHNECDKPFTHYFENFRATYTGNNSGLYNLSFTYKNGSIYTHNNDMDFTINSERIDGVSLKVMNDPHYYRDSILINGIYYRGFGSQGSDGGFLYNYQYGFLRITSPPATTWIIKIK